MKKSATLSVLVLIFVNSIFAQTSNNILKRNPRIAILGLAIESSTFSPALTNEEDFHASIGMDIFKFYPFLQPDSILRNQATWIPLLYGHALPGGVVTKEAYHSLVNKSIAMLKKNMPYDGIFFDIHGAMSVQGMEDPEADFIKKIRAVVGNKILISTSMDLHGNVSVDLAKNSDFITCYRMAPHEDEIETKRRAVSNLVNRLANGKGKPMFKAWVNVPILLPGEKTSTRIEPGKSLYAKLIPATSQEGIIDAAIWIGYAWADEPRNHAAVVVTGDDQQKVSATAEALAKSFWEVRNDFVFVAPTASLEESLNLAIASKKKPYLISDMGDNPTAGGAGDVSWTLKKILERKEFKNANGPSVIYASIPGPLLVKEALKVGVGGKVNALVGAAIDHRYAPPVLLNGTVESIYKGDIHAEVEVVVKVGSVHVIVTQKRKPYHLESDYTRLGLNPRKSDIVIVKIGYLVPELYDLRADWIMATTPGGVDQDLKRLPYKNIQRPMFPFDTFKQAPSLKAVLIAPLN
jgi:hypothetical protein